MRQCGTSPQYRRATLVIVQMRQTRSNLAKNKQGLLCPLGELYVSYSVSATKIITTKDKGHWSRKNAVYNNAEPTSPFMNKCIHSFSKTMTRYIQGGRMSTYDITRQVQAWAARCDRITHGIIQRIISPDPQGLRLAQRGRVWLV